MKGADEYYSLFKGKSQQRGRLFLQCHSHARGSCFEIILLPEGVKVEGSYPTNADNGVEVYGMTGGQRGWTETYGWLHKGKWQDDFNEIVSQEKITRHEQQVKYKEACERRDKEKTLKTDKLLSSYK